MKIDQQLRQRAEEARQQLKLTMHQTRDVIASSMKAGEHIAMNRRREAQDRGVAQALQNLPNAREKLDALRSRQA